MTYHIFNTLEIETYNQCNGVCEFCPCNKNVDKRKPTFMSEKLFMKILKDLKAMKYTGEVNLFSNNEPLLDKRIFGFLRTTKAYLPTNKLVLFTNGSLLTMDNVNLVADVVDRFVLDIYRKDNKVPNPLFSVIQHLQQPKYEKKCEFYLIDPSAKRTTRGGKAPNNPHANVDQFCTLPFRQMIIRPDGGCSQCICDTYGEVTLGDTNKQTPAEIWYGKPYMELRDKMLSGWRKELPICKECDTIG
jgi:hypothetical protein